MKEKVIKKIILTIDYELHLGKESGSVIECMITPTKKLMSLCDNFNCKMTVFWDILHYYKLEQLEEENPQMLEDKLQIESQIKELVEKGHDIQLHIHPHWLDAVYENSKWVFTYNRFSLQKLFSCEDNNDINSIHGCIKYSKELMEKVIKKYNPSYKVNVFRAGGYLIEPFNELSGALKENDILIDSSVCPNLSNDNNVFSYNFNNYPDLIKYNFKESPSKVNKEGGFLEIPVKTIYINRYRNLFYLILRRLKYKNLEINRKGTGAGLTIELKTNKRIKMVLNKLNRSYYNQLTTDSCFKEKYNFLLKKSNNYSVQILHPKLLNDHMISIMQMNLKNKKIKFISINDFLSE